MKKCEMCAEEIQDEAKICKHCWSKVNNEVKWSSEFEENYVKFKKYISKKTDLEIVSLDREILECKMILTRKEPSTLVFLILFCLWIIPWLLYAMMSTRTRDYKFSVMFNDEWKIINVTDNRCKYIKKSFNLIVDSQS